MFRTTPSLTPEQFRWLRELRTQRIAERHVPAHIRSQLLALDYIEAQGGIARPTHLGQQAIGTHIAP